jgi:hypothetical protein
MRKFRNLEGKNIALPLQPPLRDANQAAAPDHERTAPAQKNRRPAPRFV